MYKKNTIMLSRSSIFQSLVVSIDTHSRDVTVGKKNRGLVGRSVTRESLRHYRVINLPGVFASASLSRQHRLCVYVLLGNVINARSE